MPKWLFPLAFGLVITFTVFTRFYNLNWDAGHHLHPDERFLTMVVPELAFPTSVTQYFNTTTSTLNPHNRNYPFYVYGTFPLFITKLVATPLNLDDYGGILTVGRAISALLDVGIALLALAITYQITKNKWLALLALFLYTCIPSAIQLAHFFAVDTWLVFFLTLSFYLAISLSSPPRWEQLSPRGWLLLIFIGISYGLALACKITAALFLPIIILSFVIPLFHPRGGNFFHLRGGKLSKKSGAGIPAMTRAAGPRQVFGSRARPLRMPNRVFTILVTLFIFFIFSFLTFRLAQPYFFSGPGFFDLKPNPKILANWAELKVWDKPENAPPFAYQWIPTKPYIYPATHLFFWGLGIPLATLFVISLFILCFKLFKLIMPRTSYLLPPYFEHPGFWLSLLWIFLLFFYQGGQFAKAIRYLYPIMPFIALVTATVIGSYILAIKHSGLKILILASCILLPLWNALAFLSVYTRPHTRVSASTWIYEHIPPGSTITTEIWDDGIPLPEATRHAGLYKTLALPLYDPDTPEKWQPLTQQLAQADYMILTSNRLWRSISSLPQKYPVSAPFYAKLFNGSLGYETVHTSTAYPCLIPRVRARHASPLPTDPTPPAFSFTATDYCLLALNDDGAEESFTVYDHPKVIILKNTAKYSPQELYSQIYK